MLFRGRVLPTPFDVTCGQQSYAYGGLRSPGLSSGYGCRILKNRMNELFTSGFVGGPVGQPPVLPRESG